MLGEFLPTIPNYLIFSIQVWWCHDWVLCTRSPGPPEGALSRVLGSFGLQFPYTHIPGTDHARTCRQSLHYLCTIKHPFSHCSLRSLDQPWLSFLSVLSCLFACYRLDCYSGLWFLLPAYLPVIVYSCLPLASTSLPVPVYPVCRLPWPSACYLVYDSCIALVVE